MSAKGTLSVPKGGSASGGKTKFFLAIIFASLLLSLGGICLAEDKVSSEVERQLKAAGGEKGAGLEAVDPRDTLFLIIRSALGLLGFVFILLTLYAGFLWMTAGGAEENIEKAKKILTASIIGLAIILLSFAITILVFKVIMVEMGGLQKQKTTNLWE